MRTFEYMTSAGQIVGPISEPELREALSSGHVTPVTSVRASDVGVWRSLREVLALPPEAIESAPPTKSPPYTGKRPTYRQDFAREGKYFEIDHVEFVDEDQLVVVKKRLDIIPSILEFIVGLAIVSFFMAFGLAVIAALAAPYLFGTNNTSSLIIVIVILMTSIILTVSFVFALYIFDRLRNDSAAVLYATSSISIGIIIFALLPNTLVKVSLYAYPILMLGFIPSVLLLINNIFHFRFIKYCNKNVIYRKMVRILLPRSHIRYNPYVSLRFAK